MDHLGPALEDRQRQALRQLGPPEPARGHVGASAAFGLRHPRGGHRRPSDRRGDIVRGRGPLGPARSSSSRTAPEARSFATRTTFGRASPSSCAARTSSTSSPSGRTAPAATSDYHELKVKVRTAGAHVAARAGYYEKRSFKVLTPLERGLLAADMIANEIPVSQIPARILASPDAGRAGPRARAGADRGAGRWSCSCRRARRCCPMEIYVYAYDGEGRLRDYFTQGISIDLGINRERLEKGGLRYYGQLTLAPGEYRVRALVRNGETGRMGLVAETIRVPDFSQRQPYLAAPLFLGDSSDGIFVRGSSAPSGSPCPRDWSRPRRPARASCRSRCPRCTREIRRRSRSWRTTSGRSRRSRSRSARRSSRRRGGP